MIAKKLKRIPVGISDYKTIIDKDMFFVDKTLFIEEIFNTDGHVKLISRPRRFGKTLNMSMLKCFFEKTINSRTGEHTENLNTHLFTDKKIWQCPDMVKEQGQWPVIFLSFREIKEMNWTLAYEKICSFIFLEFDRHRYLLDSDKLTAKEKKDLKSILSENTTRSNIDQSLKFLTKFLFAHHKKKVIVLIDEYDTPINYSYKNGYYEEMINFSHSLFHSVLKDNEYLKFGVVTGVMRMAKEGIFSGLNNLSVFGVTDDRFADKFGFTQNEVDDFLTEYGFQNRKAEVKEWYDGYQIGFKKVVANLYNPWSVIQFVSTDGRINTYWDNTSDTKILQDVIAFSEVSLKKNIDLLIQGEEIIEKIDEGIVFIGIERNKKASWSLMLFAGYLTISDRIGFEADNNYKLTIPNREILYSIRKLVETAFNKTITTEKMQQLLSAIKKGDEEKFEEIFQDFIFSSVSMYDFTEDEPEKSYHLFVLGMLVTFSDEYEVKSNRESGDGRYDILMAPLNKTQPGIIIEFKKADRKENLDAAADAALQQIQDKRYTQELRAKGIKDVIAFGVACKQKKVLVKMRRGDEIDKKIKGFKI